MNPQPDIDYFDTFRVSIGVEGKIEKPPEMTYET